MAEIEVVSTAEAAKVLGVTRQNVLLMARARGLLEPVVDRPTLLLFSRSEVERLAREGWPGRRSRR